MQQMELYSFRIYLHRYIQFIAVAQIENIVIVLSSSNFSTVIHCLSSHESERWIKESIINKLGGISLTVDFQY